MTGHRRLPLFAAVSIALSACSPSAPIISSVYPPTGDLGSEITITGSGFGAERDLNAVSIAGIEPTASAYREWSDSLIRVQVPPFGDSGLVYVRIGKKLSNPALFTNSAAIPVPVKRNMADELPTIESISPKKSSPGSLVVLSGRNFGETRGTGSVSFAWAAEDLPRTAAGHEGRGSVAANEQEFAYELWSDREIRVRVPEGAKTGPVQVNSPTGKSGASAWFEVDMRAGTRSYREKLTYAISYSVNFQVQKASKPNTLYLWLPSPLEGNAQSGNQLLSRTAEPFIETSSRHSLYRFKNLETDSRQTITVQRTVEVWAVETSVQPEALRKSTSSPLRSAFTLSNELIPADNPGLAALARDITAKNRNDWARAQSLYQWILDNVFIADTVSKTTVLEDFASLQSDPCNAALLFCALARSLEIPAIPVCGFLVAKNRASRPHWWAEFWLEDYGWVPVDPSLGAGTIEPSWIFKDNAREYYFGNIDSQRIAFSRGFAQLSQMDPRGRTASRPKTYAFQNIWEEAVGDLNAYSTLWSELSVTGIY